MRDIEMSSLIILLSTYNGEIYLKEQIDSLYAQTYRNIKIIVRDDGSSDKTLEILNSYKDIEIINSKNNLGAKESFAILLEYALQNTSAEYFMFCDQDDIWKNAKITKTLKKMKELKDQYVNLPLLLHTDLEVVDEDLNILNKSFMSHQGLNYKYNKFYNLLVQNTITGCTMLINRNLAKLALPLPLDSIMHDWWIGLVASQFGKIDYLDESTIRYRQHKKNTIGAKKFNLRYIIQHIFKSDLLSKNTLQAKDFLERYRNDLDATAINMLEEFSTIQSKSFWQRRKILLKYKLFKQGLIRNIGLMVKI